MTANEYVMVPRDSIIVDGDFNSRKQVDQQEILSLAKQIKKDGQLQPVMVYPVPDTDGKGKGKGKGKGESGEVQKYFLLFGFRRYAAICGPSETGCLDRPEIAATVVPAPRSEVDAYYVNLAENVAREDLTPYDASGRFAELVERGEKGTTIASRLGKSVAYVNNLVRIRKNCSPTILQRWSAECNTAVIDGKPIAPKLKVCTTDFLAKLAKLNHEEQDAELNRLLGLSPEPEDDSSGGGGRGSNPTVKRPSAKALEKALEAARKTRETLKAVKDRSTAQTVELAKLDGLVAGLNYALGHRDNLPGVALKDRAE